MPLDDQQAQVAAARIRRQTSNADLLALCDYVLAVTIRNQQTVTNVTKQSTVTMVTRKRNRAAYMRDYRARGKGSV